MAPGTLAPADGEAHDPQNQKDERGDPQEMEGEPGTEEDQDEQQGQKKHHEKRLPFSLIPTEPQ
jgi:hypothetical protein